jgi:hypothetical protein
MPSQRIQTTQSLLNYSVILGVWGAKPCAQTPCPHRSSVAATPPPVIEEQRGSVPSAHEAGKRQSHCSCSEACRNASLASLPITQDPFPSKQGLQSIVPSVVSSTRHRHHYVHCKRQFPPKGEIPKQRTFKISLILLWVTNKYFCNA